MRFYQHILMGGGKGGDWAMSIAEIDGSSMLNNKIHYVEAFFKYENCELKSL